MKKSHVFTILITAIVGLTIIGFTAYKVNLANSDNGGRVVKTSGKALVGGPFNMVNQDGEPVTEKDFRGKYMLIFFGYTFCPDVCPTELQVITAALEQLGDGAKNIQPVFVSIDPERDTPAVMKEYVANFYPGMIGLTGSKEQVAEMAKRFLVVYSKVAETGTPAKEYAMDHTSSTYLMGPDGNFIKHFSYGTDPDKLAKGLLAAIRG